MATTRKRGNKPGQVPRGEQTRQRLLEAGIKAFARFAPEEVGIRRLAAAAGVNSAALSYYFGGKEGYYRAVLRYLAESVGRSIREAADSAVEALSAHPGPENARRLLCRLLRTVVTIVLTNAHAEAAAAIVWRELLRPSSGFPIVYEQMIRPVHESLTKLTAAAMNINEHEPEAVLLAHSLWGQVAIFRLGFHVLRRRLKWPARSLSAEWVERIADSVERLAARALPPEQHLSPMENQSHRGGILP